MFFSIDPDNATLRSLGLRLFLGFLVFAPLRAQEMGAVTIRVVDSAGMAVDCAVDSFTSLDHKLDLSSHFERGLQGSRIPYGIYIYTLSRKPPFFSAGSITHRVEIKRPETLSVIVVDRFPVDVNSRIAADSKAPHTFLISGKIDPFPPSEQARVATPGERQDEPVWIQLSPLFDGEGLAVNVDSLGNFRIFENLQGRYIFSVVQGSALLATREVFFQQTGASPTPFAISIRPEHPTPIFVK